MVLLMDLMFLLNVLHHVDSIDAYYVPGLDCPSAIVKRMGKKLCFQLAKENQRQGEFNAKDLFDIVCLVSLRLETISTGWSYVYLDDNSLLQSLCVIIIIALHLYTAFNRFLSESFRDD